MAAPPIRFVGMGGYDNALRTSPLSQDELKDENLIRHIAKQQTDALRYAREVEDYLASSLIALDSLGGVLPSIKQKLIQEFNASSRHKKDLKQDYIETKIAILRTSAQKARLPIDPSIP